MPQPILTINSANGVFLTAQVAPGIYAAFAAVNDGLGHAVLQLGQCTDPNVGGFVATVTFNCGTGEIRSNGVSVLVP
jgi:hypothetical protein